MHWKIKATTSIIHIKQTGYKHDSGVQERKTNFIENTVEYMALIFVYFEKVLETIELNSILEAPK